jgi:hypothetical protein
MTKNLRLCLLAAGISVSISCARHEGFSDCHGHPDVDFDQVVQITQNNITNERPLTMQQGLQILMGTQGVIDCQFTGL